MAVCEIWDVKGRLDQMVDYAKNPDKTMNPKYSESDLQSLGDVMNYATNDAKTEQRFFVSGVNCDPATAREEMQITKAQYDDQSKIVCYHGYQSFKPGEVTPEQAHEIGVKLADKMWGERFQVVVATHLNTDCFHNHFVVNSISFADGKHYHDNKKNLRLLRQRSDELCREYALSVIEKPAGRKQPYGLYQAEKLGLPNRDVVARKAVDEAIAKSYTMKDFDRNLAEMGYRINYNPNRKYWTIIGEGWERGKRLYRLGDDYTNERITERIRDNSYTVKFTKITEAQREVRVFRLSKTPRTPKKIGGLRGLYLHYCYRLGILPKGRKMNYARLHYLLKDDLMKMDVIAKETRLLCRHHIGDSEHLFSYKESLETKIQQLTGYRKQLYKKLRSTDSKLEQITIKSDIKQLSKELREARKEVRLCDGIAARSENLKSKMQIIRADEQADEQAERRKEMIPHEHRRRSGRTSRPNESTGR